MTPLVPEDALSLKEGYTRRALAAAHAAEAAVKVILPYARGTEVEVARIEAAGRIAAALILADREAR